MYIILPFLSMEDDQPKRYKRRLDPNYSRRHISGQTHDTWTKRALYLSNEGI